MHRLTFKHSPSLLVIRTKYDNDKIIFKSSNNINLIKIENL